MARPSGVNHIANACIYGDFVSSYAERKSRFVKWLGKIFKNGPRRGGNSGVGGGNGRNGSGRYNSPFVGEETMASHSPSRSREERSRAGLEEEMDHALAPSLNDNFKKPSGYRLRTEDDEELARSMQGNSPAYAPYVPPYAPPYGPSQYYHGMSRLCGGCHCEIGYANYLGCMGNYYHPDCFRCHSCCYPITENEFSLSGKDPYHKSCFKELTHPKCEVCLQFIPTNAAGLIEYRCHPFWLQKYCPSHEYDSTARCCSCERLESWNARYYSLEDGRSLCLECMESSIMDTGDCQPLYHAIRDYYEGMNMKLDQQIPMLLVERTALNEAIVGEKTGYHHMPETRGLCLSEEQTVTSISKRPNVGGRQLIGLRTQPQKLTRKCEVTAILVLYGLPRLLTGAILAHELMHGWLRLKGYRNLSPDVEEGICQMLSHMWLESEVLPGSRGMPSTSTASSSSSTSSSSKKGWKSGVENKLGEFFMYQIAHDASPNYGEGFGAANAAVNKYGLLRTLDHIRLTRSFPE